MPVGAERPRTQLTSSCECAAEKEMLLLDVYAEDHHGKMALLMLSSLRATDKQGLESRTKVL